MDNPIVVGIDIGTTKICTLVARKDTSGKICIIGVGIEPSQGLKKGMIVDLSAASQAVARSIDKAERTSGMEITSALVSMSGSKVSSSNPRGVVGVAGRVIDANDVARAFEAAQAVSLPHGQEIIHIIQRGFIVDGQEGIRKPVGMHGFRLEVETHIITASSASVENLYQCVGASGVEVSQLVLNPLASGEVLLTETERQMGVVVCDMGGGTTDLAIYIDGDVWHTAIIPFGGNHITSDIAQGLRLPISQAEEIKIQHGYAIQTEQEVDEYFNIKPFGEPESVQINRNQLGFIIEARVEEMAGFILQEIKRSGYDGLLAAGIVLTGGCSLLPGIRELTSRVLGVPVRLGKPENLLGMTDHLNSPAFSTSIGILHWAYLMNEFSPQRFKEYPLPGNPNVIDWERVKGWVSRLLP